MRLGGIGAIYSLPSGANPTPIPLAISKSAEVSIKSERKPLRGQWMDPIDVFHGARDITLKFSNCDFRAATCQMALQGSTLTANSTKLVAVESSAVPTTPFQITVSQSANFSEDGGVLNLTTGAWLSRVASGPATGQYSVSAGVYTFNTAQSTNQVQITYTYTATTSGSQTLVQNNQLVGVSTGYLCRLFTNFSVGGTLRSVGFEFPTVHFPELSIAFAADDWAEQSLTGFAAQNSTAGSIDVVRIFLGE